MQYKTNQLNKIALFSNENYQHIAQDFWVYKFTTVNPSYKYSLIDDLKQRLANVKSVVYLQGKTFYVLFEKAKFKDEFELEGKIESLLKGNSEVNYLEVSPNDLQVPYEKEYEREPKNKRHLAQLLFNGLANTSSKNVKSSNITGGLYWVVNTKNSKDKNKKPYISKYITLKLELDYHLHLKLGVQTFTSIYLKKYMNFKRTKFEDLPKYEITSGSIRTMKRIKFSAKDENRKDVYVQRQVGEKSTVPFLAFSDWNSFETSKSGVLYLFLKEVQEQLAKYITIKFVELPFSEKKTEFDKKLSDSVKANIKAFYQKKPIIINIADSLKDNEKANKLAQDLQTFLTDQERNYKAANVSIGNLSENALNFRIIYNESYYKNNNIADEYCNDKSFLVHHITTDNFDIKLEKTQKEKTQKLLSSPAIDVILKESYIKNDIRQNKITILDWTFGEWLFMGKEKIKEEEEIKETNKDAKYAFHLLKVLENGGLEFITCPPDQIFSNPDYEKLKAVYQTYDKFNGREFLNCLLVSNYQDINLIFETPRFTIQEIENIGETLELEAKDDDKFLSRENIIRVAKNFLASDYFEEKDRKSVEKLITLLERYKAHFSKKELLNLFGKEKANFSNKGNNHLQGRFCKFYREQTGDVLKSFFRGKAEKEELLSSRLDIYYQVNEKETEAFYFVGESSNNPNNPINSSFHNATNIRKIKTVKNLKKQESKLIFDQLLHTMAVDFVKQGSLTVIPFPFKYLREIQK